VAVTEALYTLSMQELRSFSFGLVAESTPLLSKASAVVESTSHARTYFLNNARDWQALVEGLLAKEKKNLKAEESGYAPLRVSM